jgi:hypothetical protein
MGLANQVAAFSMAVLITNISEPAEEPKKFTTPVVNKAKSGQVLRRRVINQREE